MTRGTDKNDVWRLKRKADEIIKENPAWLKDYESVVSSLQAIAYYGLGNEDLGELYLQQFLKSPLTTVARLATVAGKLRDIDQLEPALALLLDANRRDPGNEVILSAIIEIELDLGESRLLSERVNQLLSLRRPTYGLLEDIMNEFHSDRFILTPGRESMLESLAITIEEKNIDGILFPLREPPSIETQEDNADSAG